MKTGELRKLRREANQKLIVKNEQLLSENQTLEARTYNRIKQWKWWHLGPIFGLFILGIALSFLVGYLTKDTPKNPGWQGSAWCALGYCSFEALVWLILGFNKNRTAMHFYQDRRYRYRLTYQPREAWIRVIRRIILISWIPFAIFTIVLLCVL